MEPEGVSQAETARRTARWQAPGPGTVATIYDEGLGGKGDRGRVVGVQDDRAYANHWASRGCQGR